MCACSCKVSLPSANVHVFHQEKKKFIATKSLDLANHPKAGRKLEDYHINML